MNSPYHWLGLTIFFIAIQGFFSMSEMACVSFNKVRLEYYRAEGVKRARWLQHLLKRPSRLFGTTLLGVNLALQMGSECSRQLYLSIGWSPDLVPLTQTFVVVIFAELCPMFAARRHSEHVSMLAVPVLYGLSKVLKPLIWLVEILSSTFNRFFGGTSKGQPAVFSREELQKLIEIPDDAGKASDFNGVLKNIFNIPSQMARDIMLPLKEMPLVSTTQTVALMRDILRQVEWSFLPVYQKSPKNIVGVVFARDLLNAGDSRKVKELARSPWFVPQDTPVQQLLLDFRRNRQKVGVVLGKEGGVIGFLTLEKILDEIFEGECNSPRTSQESEFMLEKTFPATMPIKKFNEYFGAQLDEHGGATLAQLVNQKLGHIPKKGEQVRIDSFELLVVEVNLWGARKIAIKTLPL